MDQALARAISRIENLLRPEQYSPEHLPLKAVARLKNGHRILNRISSSANVEDLRDYLAEVHYALTFAGIGFEVEVEPDGTAGVDLRISMSGDSLRAEVTRLRLSHEMPRLDLTEENPILPCLGDPLVDVRRAYQKAHDKLRQLTAGPGILAVWNDDEVLDELHMRTAVKWLQDEASAGRIDRDGNLILVLYHTNWIAPSNPKEFYTWSIRDTQDAWVAGWREALETARLGESLESAIRHLLSE